MATPLRVLIAEDRPADAELMVYELRRSGFEPKWRRVETEAEYVIELAAAPDVILADNTLPQFNAPRALELLKETALDIPLIVITGSISEEVAVERIKQGAADYILKDRMTRLGAAVERALEEKRVREEKRLADASQRESEARRGAILESALDCIVTMDHQGKIVEFNPAAEKTFGYARAEVMGREMAEVIIPPSFRERHRLGLARYLTTGEGPVIGKRLEITAIRADGTEFPVELSIIRIPSSKPPMFTGFIRDITERKTAEEDLRARYHELQALHEIGETILTAPDLKTTLEKILDKAVSIGPFDLGTILLVDPSGKKIQAVASRGYRDPGNLQRQPRKEVQGRPQHRVLSYEKTFVVENVAEADGLRTLKKEGVQSAVLTPVRAGEKTLGFIQVGSRTPRKFNADKIRLLEATGNQMGIAIQKARFYEETKRNLERIRALHEIDLAITSTLDLRMVLEFLLNKMDVFLPHSSATTVRLLNKESGLLEPVACRNLNEVIWKAEVGRAGRGLANVVFETKVPLMVRNAQADPRTRDREFFTRYGLVSYLGVPLMAKREVLGVLGFYTKEEHQYGDDEIEFLKTLAGQAAIAIHNAKLYEETKKQAIDLERSNRVKDEFLSVMSHELRTPLNVVMGYTGMVKDGMLGEINPEQEATLQKVLSQAANQLNMINSIMQTTQLEARAIVTVRHPINLKDLLDKLKSDYDASLEKKDLTLIWDYPSDLVPIVTDSAKLNQILQNLINNAIKFTERGQVTISARIIGGQTVEFKVADTGIGIAKEMLSIIFDKFRQVDSSETRLYGGIGLGLFIVKEYTELLGGTVEVQSEPGKGSTFTVTISSEVASSEDSPREKHAPAFSQINLTSLQGNFESEMVNARKGDR